MLAFVLGQVDEIHCLAGQVDGALGHGGGLAQEGDDGAVMAGVGGIVQQGYAGGVAHHIHNCFDHFGAAAFADIGDAFQNFSHGDCSPFSICL